MHAGDLGDDKQYLADLPICPTLGDRCEHVSLTLGDLEEGGRRGRPRVLETVSTGLRRGDGRSVGEQLELTPQRSLRRQPVLD
jgi:hypothetical protein